MCGIVGYIGKKNSIPFLIKGLEKLEYRGYDSSGLAINKNNKIKILKKEGRLNNLKSVLENKKDFCANLGIGHTRWATHGNPSDINSHPHISSCGKFALVHNGIIENYIEIKEILLKKGYKFVSNTDTEIIVQLISDNYNGDLFSTIKNTVNQLKGSFALGIICSDDPKTLIAVNKDSPLVIGIGLNENYIASDVPALLSQTNKICRLLDKQIALIKSDNFELFDFNGKSMNKEIKEIKWKLEDTTKNGYEHFMIKEIMEQPKVIDANIYPRIKNYDLQIDDITFSENYINNLKKIVIVACGSAYHVGCVAKYFMETLIRKPVEVDIASEFRYRNPILDKNTLVIIISQSGETADSIAALREAKRYGSKIISIVNVIGSTIANESDNVIYTHAGPEIAVATTKAYTAQLVTIYILGLHLCKLLKRITNESFNDIIENIKTISSKVSQILDNRDEILYLAEKYCKYDKVFFIGRNLDYPVCMEGSLKLKEISYIHSEAYAAGELKHGTISLIDENTLVIALATQDNLIDKLVSNIRELKSRNAKILSVTTKKFHDKILEVSDDIFCLPEILNILTPSLSVISFQLFSYYVAKLLNCDIDKPKNLAKSVTVE